MRRRRRKRGNSSFVWKRALHAHSLHMRCQKSNRTLPENNLFPQKQKKFWNWRKIGRTGEVFFCDPSSLTYLPVSPFLRETAGRSFWCEIRESALLTPPPPDTGAASKEKEEGGKGNSFTHTRLSQREKNRCPRADGIGHCPMDTALLHERLLQNYFFSK